MGSSRVGSHLPGNQCLGETGQVNGSEAEADAYRAAQAALIKAGRFKDAIMMDIIDIRKQFGNKYNEGIDQMVEYAKSKGYWK